MKKLSKQQIERLVEKTYDKTALKYAEVFGKNPNYLFVLKKFIKKIPKGAKALDAGCGVGAPVTKFLAKRFNVTGIDISPIMLAMARKNVPTARFKRMSLTNLKFKPETFNLICSFFALFHVKKSEIPQIIKKFSEMLKKNGYLVLSLGECRKEGEYVHRFFGEKMYFAATSRERLKEMLKENGLKIIFLKYLYFTYAEKRKEKETFVIAQKELK